MIYLLVELININTYIYLLEINRTKSSPKLVLLMDLFKGPTRQTIKGRGKKKTKYKRKKRRNGRAGQGSIPGSASLTNRGQPTNLIHRL
jgi:hypothetical protein